MCPTSDALYPFCPMKESHTFSFVGSVFFPLFYLWDESSPLPWQIFPGIQTKGKIKQFTELEEFVFSSLCNTSEYTLFFLQDVLS